MVEASATVRCSLIRLEMPQLHDRCWAHFKTIQDRLPSLHTWQGKLQEWVVHETTALCNTQVLDWLDNAVGVPDANYEAHELKHEEDIRWYSRAFGEPGQEEHQHIVRSLRVVQDHKRWIQWEFNSKSNFLQDKRLGTENSGNRSSKHAWLLGLWWEAIEYWRGLPQLSQSIESQVYTNVQGLGPSRAVCKLC